MVNFFSLLPNELIVKIGGYVHRDQKNELLLVDRRTNAAFLEAVRWIRVFPARPSYLNGYPSDIPENILVSVIRRYPQLVRITFGPPKNIVTTGEFGGKEVLYLKSLIAYLNSDPANHPLRSVKKMECMEITPDVYNGFGVPQARELNNLFLGAIGHESLEKLCVQAYCPRATLTGSEIQSALNNSPQLKTFVFNSYISKPTVKLSFAGQSLLSKVKLLDWKGDASTIESLKHCKKLEELVIHYEGFSDDQIKAILFGEHGWDLKRLELKGMSIRGDTELDELTKKLPNLECLNVYLMEISDEGMELLGKNCPKLKILRFSIQNITDSGLARLTQHIPHLETISFDQAYNITHIGIAAIAQNCKKLRLIQVAHFRKIERAGIDALVENCPDLRAVEFTNGGRDLLPEMIRLAQEMPNLRHVTLIKTPGIPCEQIQKYYKLFPHLSNIPFTLSAKKLHRLTLST